MFLWKPKRDLNKSFSTSCGFINYFSNQNPIVETNVFIEFSPSSDLYNQEVTIPVSIFKLQIQYN